VDCFRYRNKIGLDDALEALREAVRARAASVDEIMRAAEVCRARTIMRTYLEALSPTYDRIQVVNGPGGNHAA